MKKITLNQLKRQLAPLFFALFLSMNLSAQTDTLIIGYKTNISDAQKKILPRILGLTLVDSITLFNQYKYVMPDTIFIDTLQINPNVIDDLISEFGHNLVFDAEEKKRVAGKTSEDQMAGAEGMDLNFEISLDLPSDAPLVCGYDACLTNVTSPVDTSVCNLSSSNCSASRSVKVAVLDTGCEVHDDYSSQIDSMGYNLVTSSNAIPVLAPIQDLHIDYHGGKVVGEIVASSCCSADLEILSITILDEYGQGFLWNMLKAIAIAIEEEVEIINISAGFTDNNPLLTSSVKRPLEKAIEVAGLYDILVVTSAGNKAEDNDIIPHFPSNYSNMDHVIAVGASCTGLKEEYSNWGKNTVTLMTSGNHNSTVGINGHAYGEGTSFAAAAVTGFAAFLKINTPIGVPISASDLKQVMEDNTDKSVELSKFCVAGGELNPTLALASWESQFCPAHLQSTNDELKANQKTIAAPLVYPSPFSNEISIDLELGREKPVYLSVYNVNGQLLYQEQRNLEQGRHSLQINPVSEWTAGFYWVQIKIKQEIFNYKLVKI